MRFNKAGSWLWLVICVWTGPLWAQEPSSEPVRSLSDAELVSALRAGGNVLYFRHASTDFSQNDDKMTSFEDCANQRNLIDKGRNEARAIGAAMRELRIPIGAVLSSPFCRTMESATLAFGKAQKTMDLRGWHTEVDPKRYAPLRPYLSKAPAAGTNTVLMGHGNPFRAIAGPPHLAEGEAAVIKPLGGERYEIVARVPVGRWEELVKAGK